LLRKIAGFRKELRILFVPLPALTIPAMLFFFTSHSFAQKKQIDSLTRLISTEKIDSNKIKLTNELAWVYYQDKQSEKAQKIAFENIERAKKLNWNKGIANSYETLADFYYNSSQFDSSTYYLSQALSFYRKTNDYPQICYTLGYLGGQFREINKFAESKKYLVEAYDLAVKINSYKYQKQSLDRLGWLYHNMGNNQLAIDYFEKALDLVRKKGSKRDEIDIKNSIANTLIALGKYGEAQKLFFEMATYLRRQNDLKHYAYNLSVGANLYRRLNQNEKAEKPLLEVYQIQKDLKDDWSLLTTARYLGMLYTEQKRFVEAEKYLNETLYLAQKFNNSSDKAKAYYTLERLYFAKNDFKEGDKYQKLIIRFRDSLYTADQNKALAEFDVKYKTTEKERLLAQSNLENAQKQNWIVGLSIGLISLIGFGFLFYRIRETKQRGILQEIEIEKQREILKAKEIERQRIAKELHDSVGSQLTVVSTSLDNAFFLAENQRLVPQKLESINKDVREAAQSLRDTIWATHNSAISITNLYSRIQHYLSKITEDNHNLQIVSNRLGNDYELNSIQALNIFRVFQEAIQNIQKHAEATQINIGLSFEQGQLGLSIGDNGRGFDKGKLSINENFGLSNMKNRSDEIGANFSVDSEVGKGTTVTLALPLT
jgi:signal transduction histidine kinase